MRPERTAPCPIGFFVAVVFIALVHTIPTCAQTALNAATARNTYDRGLRHFYWLYTFDPVGHQRRDWYQESAATWNETYEDGRYNHSRVVDANATVDGNNGIICVGDTSTLRLFIPNPDAHGANPNWLRIQQSGATSWTLFAPRIEGSESQDHGMAGRISSSQSDSSNTQSNARAEAQTRADARADAEEEARERRAEIKGKIDDLKNDIDSDEEMVEHTQNDIDDLNSCSGIGAAICQAGMPSLRSRLRELKQEIADKRHEIAELRGEQESVAADNDASSSQQTPSTADSIVDNFRVGMQRAQQMQPPAPTPLPAKSANSNSSTTSTSQCHPHGAGNAVTGYQPGCPQ
jgi:hypothetical protein